MKPDWQSSGQRETTENELDVRGLFCVLWRGKALIIAVALLFALVALVSSYVVKQQWSSTAIADKPTVNMLGSYFSQQQFLRNLDVKNTAFPTSDMPSIADDAFQEFLRQVASYDTRRNFWLASDYFTARKEGDARADAALLDEMINNIQFTPRDDSKKLPDQLKLVAETPGDANTLLRAYVAFANQRAAQLLNDEVKGAWAARTVSMKAQVKRQEAVAKTIYDREITVYRQALELARQQGITRRQTATPPEELPQSELFMLGHNLLQARLDALQVNGPAFDVEYDQNRAMLATLNVGPVLQDKFQTYRYLRTPEEPVKRDKPRRLFLLILWGSVGVLVGAGLVLARRR